MSGDGRRVLLAGVLVYLGFSALWTYSGRIGAAVGLSLAEMGAVVTGCGLLGVVGPLTAGAVGLRWGRTPPLLATLGLVVLAAASAAMAGSCAGVALSLLVAMPAFMAFVTYLRSAMAAIDPTGRLVGLGVGVLTVGAAAGPSLVGLALEAGGSYGMIGWLALACGGAAAALLVPIAKAIDARERPHSHIAPAGTPTPAFAHQTCEEERS